jgi:hypothetical protein
MANLIKAQSDPLRETEVRIAKQVASIGLEEGGPPKCPFDKCRGD